MEKEKYINRQPNFKPDDVKRWNDSENNITAIPIELAERMQNTFNELAKANSNENDFQRVQEANELVKANVRKRVKQLENEKRAGYVAISTLTIIGTLLIGAIIFMVVGNIIGCCLLYTSPSPRDTR